MVRRIIMLSLIIVTIPAYLNGCIGAGYISAAVSGERGGRGPDGHVMEPKLMLFADGETDEYPPYEGVPCWNGAEMSAYLLDGVYHARIQAAFYDEGALFRREARKEL